MRDEIIRAIVSESIYNISVDGDIYIEGYAGDIADNIMNVLGKNDTF